MTKHDFAVKWAEQSGMSLGQLKEKNMFPARCFCNGEGCNGFQMVSAQSVPHLLELNQLDIEDVPDWVNRKG